MVYRRRQILTCGLALWMLALSTSWSFQHQHHGGGDLHGHRLGLVDLCTPADAASRADDTDNAHSHVLFLGIELGGCCFPCLPRGPGEPRDEVPVSLAPADSLVPPSLDLPLGHGPADGGALPPAPAPTCVLLVAGTCPAPIATPLCAAALGARSGVLLI